MKRYHYILLFLLVLFFIKTTPKFHHSRINALYSYDNPPKVNLLKYPLYYFTKPIVFELFPGDCLYIPYGWWHWIFSKGENMALNQWFPKSKKIKPRPFKFKNINFKDDLWETEIVTEKIKGNGFGGGSDYPNICSFIKIDRVYPEEQHTLNMFTNLKEVIETGSLYKKYIAFLLEDNLPPEYKNQLIDLNNIEKYNFWYYSNGANSGLHYDNYENYLCQMKGSKKVYLFPPIYTRFLYGDTILKSSVY
jgi:hypothetical protein